MNEKPSFSAVVFDMDGVIFDSESVVLACWRELAERHGIPGIEETFRACLGTNEKKNREIFFQRYGAEFPTEDFFAESRALFYEKCPDHPPVMDYAPELLRAIRDRGVPMALASSTRLATVRRQLGSAGLLEFFNVVVGGDLISRSKPAPDIYLRACELLGVAPGTAVAVEDSFNGIRSAHAAGLFPLMVPDQAQPTEEIRALCGAVVPSLRAAETFLFG